MLETSIIAFFVYKKAREVSRRENGSIRKRKTKEQEEME